MTREKALAAATTCFALILVGMLLYLAFVLTPDNVPVRP